MNVPSSPAPLLHVQGVTLQYRPEKHLDTATYRVSFDVHSADRFVLLGPSGCGKSTLLKAVGGYMAPTGYSCFRSSTSCCRGKQSSRT